jgi:hypothetical protein
VQADDSRVRRCCAEVCFGSNRSSTNFLESSVNLLSSKEIILSFMSKDLVHIGTSDLVF